MPRGRPPKPTALHIAQDIWRGPAKSQNTVRSRRLFGRLWRHTPLVAHDDEVRPLWPR
jgi:hypothetical protein